MDVRNPTASRIGPATSVYDCEPLELARAYESVSFVQLYAGVSDLLPRCPSCILDVGAGSGRDAAALAALGHQVTAVEPSTGMREVGKKLHPGVPIAWIADSLPGLSSFRDRTSSFDLILVSAVWMHLAKKEREPAARRLAELLAPAGVIIVTLRHGPQDEERGIADIPDDELSDMMGRQGLTLIRKLFERDLRGRSEIAWSTLVYRKASLDRPPLEAMIADIK